MIEQATDQTTELAKANPDLELTLLRQRADTMGLAYHPSIKLETLRKKIQEALDKQSPAKTDGYRTNVTDDEDEPDEAPRDTEAQMRKRVREDALRLVRCRIYNLNPEKRDLHGEIITVANKVIGTVAKMIPFGEATDNGYHIPWVIYKNLKARQFQSINTKKTKEGTLEIIRRMVPEYNIEIMEPLTAEELEELALRQAASARLQA